MHASVTRMHVCGPVRWNMGRAGVADFRLTLHASWVKPRHAPLSTPAACNVLLCVARRAAPSDPGE